VSYGVTWKCPKDGWNQLDVCSTGALVPREGMCLNCGHEGEGSGACSSCGMSCDQVRTYVGPSSDVEHCVDRSEQARNRGLVRRATR